uniref:Uncharacterized protein n=1 Tax=Physcomitrium patens TaxID=3218 RepID=A0A7I4APE5_PHYPA
MVSEITDTSSSGAGSAEETKTLLTTRSCRECLLYSSVIVNKGVIPSVWALVGAVNHKCSCPILNWTTNFAHKEVSSSQTTQPIDITGELPYCYGLEFLDDRKPTTQAVPSANSVPPPKALERLNREDCPNAIPRPPSSIGGSGGGGLSSSQRGFFARLK